MPSSDRQSFWKDKANLGILNEEVRVKWWLGMLGGMVAIIILFALGDQLGLKTITSRVAAAASILLLSPAAIAIDMWFKGGAAGAQLMDDNSEMRRASGDKTTDRQSSIVLTETQQELEKVLAHGKRNRPGSGRNVVELRAAQLKFDNEFKAKLIECICACNEKNASNPGLEISVSDLEKTEDYHQLHELAESKKGIITVLRAKL
ncbi:hypothetical protein Pan258_17220 [Symmachiella dynata]|uniref:hypothetical protein n=1 Tax=Symmachiella dynata TaxID=2527995 RepID=UPI00118850FF|nr:hypothetical protein [Symmachiella dynata]QDT47686.1 hypothetical protein Pan258_17220 [Symmachiella dynata]